MREQESGPVGLLGMALGSLIVAGCLVTIPEIKIPEEGTTTPASTSTTTTTTIPPAPVDLSGELCDPPLTEAEVAGTRDGYDEECGMEAHHKIIFRGHTIRPSVKGYWKLTSPWLVNGKPVLTEKDGMITVPDTPFRGVVFHCRGWCRDEPAPHDLDPKLDFVGATAPRGTKHAIIECRKVR